MPVLLGFVSSPAEEDGNEAALLTVFLRHDQSKTLDEINRGTLAKPASGRNSRQRAWRWSLGM
jgi:hypothetical protein